MATKANAEEKETQVPAPTSEAQAIPDSETSAASPDKPKSVMTEAQMDDVARSTGAALAAQSKRTVKLFQVPAGSTDSPLPDEVVCVNGYIYQIQRGVEVEIPETVYEILSQAGRF